MSFAGALDGWGLLAEEPREGKTLETVVVTTLILGVTTGMLKMVGVVGKLKPNEEAARRKETEGSVGNFAAMALVGGVFNFVLGTLAVLLWHHSTTVADPQYQFHVPVRNAEEIFSPLDARVFYTSMLLGQLFFAYTVHMTLMWCLGWDKGIDTLLHHIGFIIVCCIMVPKGAYHQLGLAAMSMEISTPPLLYYLTFRQVTPARPSADHAAYLFSFLFIISRVFGFGYVYFKTLYGVYTTAAYHPPNLTTLEGSIVLGLLGLGWGLQLYWSKAIFSKLFNLVKG